MSAYWYALQTQSQREHLVAERLRAQGFAVFYPQLQVKPVNPRARTVRPFFPCYVFVHADLAQSGTAQFQYLPNAIGLVRYGELPAIVEDSLIAGIAAHIEQINAAGGELLSRIKPGDRVQIAHGPFAGYEAIFDSRMRDSDRVRLLLELIGQRQVVIELAAQQISRLH